MNEVTRIKVRTAAGTDHWIDGREAWALHVLIKRGEAGVTSLDWVGPRWSDYVMKLRHRGMDIETIQERHGGPFAGRHGRYVLRTPLDVIEIELSAGRPPSRKRKAA